ncbi:ABC transporter substrate-binding protein [Bradyrhizobium elkanii]|uniref:ABC transporter substrate-binding protein n=1 Tax=Bradyrhizobium elkanii TaxID=29448 RepID=UPI0005C19F6C|nr:ABC transporter substrate-binding protein [Bradyrhizobium elkanii]KIU47250.1 branched-chain amino acid ABC transporter substrate-binding protein [Bradyrhizobium elkanii]
MILRYVLPTCSASLLLATFGTAFAQKAYDAGATDTEIKIGNIMPYSGPASAFGILGKIEGAYYKMINDQGGINGRKINFISYDDGYSPPKAVEQARKLVESDEVLLLAGVLGTPSNSAIQKYMNARKVPQLFVSSGATRFGDYRNFPWTMGWQADYQIEGRVYATYLLKQKPDAKVAILYQNDDFGKDLLKGVKDGLGERAAKMIVAEEPYEIIEPTVESHIVKLKASGADIFFSMTTPKAAAQSIKKAAELGWKPVYFQSLIGASSTVLKSAGYDNAQGILSAAFSKDTDRQWDNDEGMKRLSAFLAKYAPEADKGDGSVVYAYGVAETVVQVLRQCGDTLTRENIMKQAANLKDFAPDILLPGIFINTSPTDYYPVEQLRMMRFKGDKWEMFGDVIDGKRPE